MTTAAPFFEVVVPRHADYRRVFTWRDANGNLVNLTGYRVIAAAKVDYDSEDYLWYLDSDGAYSIDGEIVLGGALGTIELVIPEATTDLLDYEEGVWDMKAYAPDGTVDRLAQGTTRLDLGVTP